MAEIKVQDVGTGWIELYRVFNTGRYKLGTFSPTELAEIRTALEGLLTAEEWRELHVRAGEFCVGGMNCPCVVNHIEDGVCREVVEANR